MCNQHDPGGRLVQFQHGCALVDDNGVTPPGGDQVAASATPGHSGICRIMKLGRTASRFSSGHPMPSRVGNMAPPPITMWLRKGDVCIPVPKTLIATPRRDGRDQLVLYR